MSFETGKIGRQADGAVVARIADTIVHSTVCYDKETTKLDFSPLRVDYFARFRYDSCIAGNRKGVNELISNQIEPICLI